MKNLSLPAVVVTAAMVLVGFDAFADEPASGGLLVHLNFDEASGEVAADASGSGKTVYSNSRPSGVIKAGHTSGAP